MFLQEAFLSEVLRKNLFTVRKTLILLSAIIVSFIGNCCAIHDTAKKKNLKSTDLQKHEDRKNVMNSLPIHKQFSNSNSNSLLWPLIGKDWSLFYKYGTIYTCTTVMLSLPTVPIGPPYCSCWAAWASSWICCCCWVGVIRRKSWGSSPTYTLKKKKIFKHVSHFHNKQWERMKKIKIIIKTFSSILLCFDSTNKELVKWQNCQLTWQMYSCSFLRILISNISLWKKKKKRVGHTEPRLLYR